MAETPALSVPGSDPAVVASPRLALAALGVVVALVATGCGDRDATGGATATTSTVPGATATGASGPGRAGDLPAGRASGARGDADAPPGGGGGGAAAGGGTGSGGGITGSGG